MKSEVKITKEDIFKLIHEKYTAAGFKVSDIKPDLYHGQRDEVEFTGIIVEIDIEVPNLIS